MGTKAAIIVLVIIAVLFVGFQVWGYGNNKAQSNSDEPPSILKWFNSLGAGPKLDVKQLQPATKSFDLARQATYQVQVLADSDHAFRQAKVKIAPPLNAPCAHIVFTPTPVDGMPDELKEPQPSAKHAPKDPNNFTLAIPKAGGKLAIVRTSPFNTAPCTVALE